MRKIAITAVGGLALVAFAASSALACPGMKSAQSIKPAQTADAPMTPAPTTTTPDTKG